MWRLFYSIKAALRFRDYDPYPVTLRSAHKWLGQFEPQDRRVMGSLLNNVIYFSKDHTKRTLLKLNDQLLQRLANDGIQAKKVIYVAFHEAASSSHMMLGLLRDVALLEQRGCRLFVAQDVRGLKEITDQLEGGAIVYVDDFIGSGRQFCGSRDFWMQYVFGNFNEFMLAPTICEEGQKQLLDRGIDVIADTIHKKADRALLDENTSISFENRKRAIEICNKINPKMPLGVDQLATMVVFYRNAPNQIPAFLRGNKNLKPFCGLFPRTTDLPFDKILPQPKKKSGQG